MADAKALEQQFHDCMPLFIALGDEVRLTIIEALCRASYPFCRDTSCEETSAYPGLNVNEITQKTHLSRPAVSHHLKLLREAGLIALHREGTSNYYYLTLKNSTETLMKLGVMLQEFID